MLPMRTDEPFCPVCLEKYGGEKQTAVLRCGHTLCSPCLEQLVAMKRLMCPLCVESFHRNEKFPRNYQLEDALAHLRALTDSTRVCVDCKNVFESTSMHLCLTCYRRSAPQKNKPTDNEVKLSIVELPRCSKCSQDAHELRGHSTCDFTEVYNLLKDKLKVVKVNHVVHSLFQEIIGDKLLDLELAERVRILNAKTEKIKKNEQQELNNSIGPSSSALQIVNYQSPIAVQNAVRYFDAQPIQYMYNEPNGIPPTVYAYSGNLGGYHSGNPLMCLLHGETVRPARSTVRY